MGETLDRVLLDVSAVVEAMKGEADVIVVPLQSSHHAGRIQTP